MKWLKRFFRWFVGLFRKQAKPTTPIRIQIGKVVLTPGKRHCFVFTNGIRTRKPNSSLKADY